MLNVGDVAPDFKLNDSYGNLVKLSDYIGKKNVVLYFYPKDDTPGCTLEAQGFSERHEDYAALDAVVIGVSKDNERSHQKFCTKYGLKVCLLSDPDHKTIERYGQWQLKKFMGREFMGTVRSTFLIGKEGKILHIWPQVTPKGHEEEVLETIRQAVGQ